MDLFDCLEKLRSVLAAPAKAPAPQADPNQIKLTIDRDSVCMGDDCNSHRKDILVDGRMKFSGLLEQLAAFVPSMGDGALWSVRSDDEPIGYIMGGGRGAKTELAGEDLEVRALRSRKIDCTHYYNSRFSWTDGKSGKHVELFPECSTLLEKVKKKEALWAESCAVMGDITSKDPQRIWSGACDIVKHGQDPDWIRHFLFRVDAIEEATRGVALGGGIAPNRRFVDYALKTIRFHKEKKGCPCGLYPMTGSDCIFDPKKEAKTGYVQLVDTVHEADGRFVDHYVTRCTRCGQLFHVKEEVGHWVSWRWEKITEGVFTPYPPGSKGNPFDKSAAGRYFAYLTNREQCFSRLSDNPADFRPQNEALAQAMPMGYTSLRVLARVSIRCGAETVSFGEPTHKLTYFYCKVTGGTYVPISHYEYEQLQKDDTVQTIELAANLLEEHNWH